MDFCIQALLMVILMSQTVVSSIIINEMIWVTNIIDVDTSYDNYTWTTNISSVSLCMSMCSVGKTHDACTYNINSGLCRAFHYIYKGNAAAEIGNQLWLRKAACRNDFVSVDGYDRCIKYFGNKETWDTANTLCQSLGGNLLVVDTAEKVTKLTEYIATSIPSAEKEIYVGGRLNNNGDFEWLNGNPIDPAAITSAVSKECMKYDTDKVELENHDCNHSHAYLCQNA